MNKSEIPCFDRVQGTKIVADGCGDCHLKQGGNILLFSNPVDRPVHYEGYFFFFLTKDFSRLRFLS